MAYINVRTPITTKNGVSYNLQYDTGTGQAQIIQANAPAGTKPIYQDGKWNSSATQLGFSSAEQTQIHQQSIASVQAAYNSVGGASKGAKLPQWASQNFSNGQPGQTSVTPQNSVSGTSGNTGNGGSGNIASAILNPSETISNSAINSVKFGVDNESDIFGGNMKYPEDLSTSLQDHLVISMYSYKPSGQSTLFGGSSGALNIANYGAQSSGNLEERKGTVYLPMPQSVADSNNVSWGDDTMSNLAMAVTADTLGNTKGKGIQALAGGIVGAVTGAGFKNFASTTMQGFNAAKLIAKGTSDSLETLLGSEVTSKLVKAQGFAVESESILARGAGIVPNSNLELLFNSPTLRSFSFSYRLSPRSAEEAKMVRKIIRFFKQGMAAKKLTGKSGQASFFLGTPNVFKLEYRNGTKPIDGVNRFKTCALTSFSCNYTPDGIWAAYDAGQPVSTVFSMTFSELEPIYDTDYQENSFLTGENALSSVGSDSVGY